MLVSALAEELATELGEAYSDPDVASQFCRWVIEAVSELWDQENWSFSERTIWFDYFQGGGQIWLAPSDNNNFFPSRKGGALTVRSVVDEGSTARLEGTTREDLERAGMDIWTEGTPTHWYYDGVFDGTLALIGGQPDMGVPAISLFPQPSADGQIRVTVTYATPGTLEETDELPVPTDAFRALRENVRMRFWENAAKLELAAVCSKRWQDAVGALRRRYVSRTELDHRLGYRDIRGRGPRWPVPRIPLNIPG